MDEFKVIRELSTNPNQTQRTLADSLSLSVGKVNYIISGLMEKGIIRAKKLKNHPDKIRWQYVLTPKGVTEKLELTRSYLSRRLDEYNALRKEIEELQAENNRTATV